MFLSSYLIKDMISQIKMEVDSYSEVPESLLIMAYNTVIRQLYRGTIKDLKITEVTTDEENKVVLPIVGGARIEYEDVEKIKCGNVVYTRATAKSADAMNHTYYKGAMTEGGYDTVDIPGMESGKAVKIYHIEKPCIIGSMDEISSARTYIPLPDEYVPMVYAAVRGEAYKWVNEDALSAKWIQDYNAQLEAFSAWIGSVRPMYGA